MRPRAQPAAIAVMKAQAAAERKRLRDFEHRLDVGLRQVDQHRLTHGLRWFEDRPGAGKRWDCTGCSRTGVRLWVGIWFEYENKPGQMPYAICQTGPLCAPCVSRRQNSEQHEPIWRPRDWRAASAA